MAPYVYDYEKALMKSLSAFRYSMDAHYPPSEHKDFAHLSGTIRGLRLLEEDCANEVKKQSFQDDKENCENVATTICALAQTLEGLVDQYKK